MKNNIKWNYKKIFVISVIVAVVFGILIILFGNYKDYTEVRLRKNNNAIFSISDLIVDDLKYGDMENDIRTHHIHVVKWDGTEWKNYIHFRDCLNANENMALQYQRVKEELESKYADNRGLYTKGKKDIIDIILNN